MSMFSRRSVLRGRRRIPADFLPMVLAAVLSMGVCVAATRNLSDSVKTLAASKAVNRISLAISEAAVESLEEAGMEYSGFVDVTRNDQGEVTSLSMKITEGASFERLMTEKITANLANIKTDELSVPAGNLTGVLLYSTLGPSIRVKVRSVGDVTTKYRNEFTSAGINQTRHSVYLDVSVTVYLLIPGEVIPVTAQESVCVAETVIVGEVPNTYLNLLDGVE